MLGRKERLFKIRNNESYDYHYTDLLATENNKGSFLLNIY